MVKKSLKADKLVENAYDPSRKDEVKINHLTITQAMLNSAELFVVEEGVFEEDINAEIVGERDILADGEIVEEVPQLEEKSFWEKVWCFIKGLFGDVC